MTFINRNPFPTRHNVGLLTKAFLISFAIITFISDAHADEQRQAAKQPNVLIIYADDLGYGDVHCYNPKSKILTPNIDRLANEGMRFTDAHSAATVCTPSRYSLLTGRYAFRLPNHGRVFDGIGGPNLITEDRLSMGQMFSDLGYETGCVGKWHIGMTFFDKQGNPINKGGPEPVTRIDYERPIAGSPIDRGFDYFFGTAACPTTDWLYAFVEGNRVPNPPTQLLDKSKLPKHPYSVDNRRGWKADDFDLEAVDLIFLDKSKAFLDKHYQSSPEKPFFLYHAMQAVHLPSFPADKFKGSSDSGPHGDFIVELDFIVGSLMETLKQHDAEKNTIVIFTSDNGPEVLTTVRMRQDHQHDGAAPWRGMKRDLWEGGHRVPMIVKWPGKVPANSTTDALICQTDLMATLAKITNAQLPKNCAEDSIDFSKLLLGEARIGNREFIVHQGFAGDRKLAIRSKKWKYLNCGESGGNNYQKQPLLRSYYNDSQTTADVQLYNLEVDPAETNNLYLQEPDMAIRMRTKLEEIKSKARKPIPQK